MTCRRVDKTKLTIIKNAITTNDTKYNQACGYTIIMGRAIEDAQPSRVKPCNRDRKSVV